MEEEQLDHVGPQVNLSEVVIRGISTGFSNICGAPFETTKTLVQVQNKNPVVTQGTVPEEEGTDEVWSLEGQKHAFSVIPISQWWRANTPKAIGEFLRCFLERCIRESIDSGPEPEELLMMDRITNQPITIEVTPDLPLDTLAVTSHAISGALSGILANPFEVVHTRLLVQRRVKGELYYKDVFDAIKRIYKEEGVAGFYDGIVPTMLYYGVSTLMTEMGDQIIEEFLGYPPDDNPFLFGLCDLLWHVARVGFQIPLETIRRRLYIQGAVQRGMPTVVQVTPPTTPYRGAVDCVTRIYAEEGPGALFGGFRSQFLFSTSVIVGYYSLGAFRFN